MVKQYYEPIYHTNTTDSETDVINLESTPEEPKKINAIGILSETNNGILRSYHERDNFFEVPSGAMTESGIQEYPIEAELPVGESFLLTLQNRTAGSNATVIGYVRYEII